MLNFKRKITYFYQYHNGTVGSTAGFLKLEIRGDKVKIIINIQETPGLPYKEASLYFYHEAGDHLAAVKVDDIESRNGILTYLNRTEWQKLFDTGRDLYTFDGVAVVYNENHYSSSFLFVSGSYTYYPNVKLFPKFITISPFIVLFPDILKSTKFYYNIFIVPTVPPLEQLPL